ncbi:ABC transporter ATP-binding protein [Halobacillus sp. BAB-2008]|uniref:ABC transporter ATP-binding protein n=1 Tax=Halobacillus sp. BAB-2008 TaxID=1246484 RepID=UPI0002A4F981|nr:ABC transporter ATP-binding protein [Halobacillus sp. BAB-2008]ELK46797.1 ABC transporter [Halobacillus sp. BAB-2008]
MITIRNLSKTVGKKAILKDIQADLKGVTGIIGPNGAGKTSLLNILAGVTSHDKGAEIDFHAGRDMEGRIGFLPQNFNAYPNLTVLEVLRLLASIKGVDDDSYIMELVEVMNLYGYRNQKMKHLSGGTVQRVGIAQSLLSRPDYLIIDEPTTGLDVLECTKLRSILLTISDRVQIIISSHNPEDIAFLCNHLLVLKEGVKLFEGSMEDLKRKSAGMVFEKTVEGGNLSDVDGTILSFKSLSESRMQIRFISQTPVVDNGASPSFSDFISGYVAVLEGLDEV